MKIEPSIHTAVLKDKRYTHFGVNKHNACLYGDKLEDIVQVEVSIADDQKIPPAPQNDPNVNDPDYWAWWDNKEQRFSIIWAKHFLLEMCFPYGIKAEEDRDFGKAYRVNVKPVKK